MLTIDEVARRLNGERHGDSYMCSCPLPGHKHGDQARSLSVAIGRNGGILMHCHVHDDARIEDFAKAMGLEVKDFMPEDGEAREEKKAPKPWKESMVGDRDRNGFETTAGDVYENEDGTVGMRKCRKQRNRADGGYDKTFLMQAPKDGQWWKPSDIGSDAVHLLYHLPEVLRAIKGGEMVYIAEGEKDVDNLRALGFCATCSATGGGKGSLAGKFTDGQAAQLDGACVVLIPDNDEAGEGYVNWIAEKLYRRGTACRIARLTDDMPDLPAKGDFTDWAQILKSEGIGKKELLERFNALVEKAPVYEGPGLEVYTVSEAAEKAPLPGSAGKGPGDRSNGSGAASSETEDDDYPDYHGSSKFCIVNGCLHKRVQNGTRLLAWFVPEPTELIRRDDGQTVTQQYVIAGTASNGHPLPDALVKNVKDFLGPTWAVDAWGWDGAMSSSRGAPGEVFEAIQWAGRKNRKTRTVYAHAGMRVIDGTPCYLYHGGAIGKEDVSVELGGPLVRSNLAQQKDAQGNDITRRDAALAERILMDAYPSRVILPLLAQAYLAPVYSILEDMQVPPAHVILLDGKTNAGRRGRLPATAGRRREAQRAGRAGGHGDLRDRRPRGSQPRERGPDDGAGAAEPVHLRHDRRGAAEHLRLQAHEAVPHHRRLRRPDRGHGHLRHAAGIPAAGLLPPVHARVRGGSPEGLGQPAGQDPGEVPRGDGGKPEAGQPGGGTLPRDGGPPHSGRGAALRSPDRLRRDAPG